MYVIDPENPRPAQTKGPVLVLQVTMYSKVDLSSLPLHAAQAGLVPAVERQPYLDPWTWVMSCNLKWIYLRRTEYSVFCATCLCKEV